MDSGVQVAAACAHLRIDGRLPSASRRTPAMAAGLSVQLYTLRKEAKAQGLGPVIDRLGKIGYAGVEPAGFGELTAEAFKKRVADAGMVVSSAHIALPDPNKTNEVLDQQATIGNDTLVVPFLPPDDFKDESAVKRSADKLNA